MNPFIGIDEAYHREVAAATERHEKDAAPLNAQLQQDLAEAESQAERNWYMERFAEDIAPVQDTYHAAIEKARTKMEAAKERVAPEYEAFIEAETRARDEKTARHIDLRDKLLAGKATPVEVQEALGLTLETMVGESTTEGTK